MRQSGNCTRVPCDPESCLLRAAIHVFERRAVWAHATRFPSRLWRAGYAVFYALTYRPIFLKRQQLIMFLLACLIWCRHDCAASARRARIARFHAHAGVYLFHLQRIAPEISASRARRLGSVALSFGYLFGLDLMGPTATRQATFVAMTNCGGMLICYQMDVSARREFARCVFSARNANVPSGCC